MLACIGGIYLVIGIFIFADLLGKVTATLSQEHEADGIRYWLLVVLACLAAAAIWPIAIVTAEAYQNTKREHISKAKQPVRLADDGELEYPVAEKPAPKQAKK